MDVGQGMNGEESVLPATDGAIQARRGRGVLPHQAAISAIRPALLACMGHHPAQGRPCAAGPFPIAQAPLAR